MPLIELKTNLKDLKFGRDRRSGGDSNQPYVQVPIPEGDLPVNSPDFLLRGGFLTPNRILKDEERIGKFFLDTKTPKGLLFIANQNLLSRTAVQTEASFGPSYGGNQGGVNAGIYTPLSTLAQIAGVAFGGHLDKQGLDVTGLSNNFSPNSYFEVVKNKPLDENRLFNLYRFRILDNDQGNPVVFEYSGGPGSILGIGTTKIRFPDAGKQRTGNNNPMYVLNPDYFIKGGLKSSFTDRSDIPVEENKQKILSSGAGALYNKLKPQNPINLDPVYPQIYKSGSLEVNFQVDTKGKQKYFREVDGTVDLGSTKEFANTPYKDYEEKSDIIDFYFTVIDNDSPGDDNKIYYFPAFIDSFNENFVADWKAEKFMGRGEEFFLYNGFSRDLSLTFKVYAKNSDLINKMYQNLNSIVSTMAPNYSSGGFMRGNIVKLTIGKWIENLPGIITSMNIGVPVDNSWDINRDIQLPFYIEINSFSFKPIHDFLPNKNQKFFARNLADNE